MYAGPNLLLNIVDVLMWIRSFRLLFATDITKMYRQILVDERDVDLQRIVWVDENSAETHWQLKTVTYGTRAAPFLAIRSLLQLVKDEGHRFPSAVDSLTRGRYVDDIFGGADNDDQLKLVAQDLTNLCMAGGFPLAKWSSSSAAFRAKMPQDTSSAIISLDNCKAKILGLYWDTHEDSLKFKIMLPPPQQRISKRSILSEVAQIFDPLGIISPVTIKSKVLLQELWLHKLTWDEEVPESIRSGNSADCASRGVTVEQLSEHVLWWHGPQWLLKGDEHWPVQRDIIEPEAELEQRRAVTSVVVTQDSENYWLPISRLSSFVRLQRTTATVLLASQRMRKLSSSSELSTENLAAAKLLLIKLTQQHHFAAEIRLLNEGNLPRGHVELGGDTRRSRVSEYDPYTVCCRAARNCAVTRASTIRLRTEGRDASRPVVYSRPVQTL
ncbi:unnamed protein product [Trichogramma brassicae]|uniref:Reverse transcriptase domain-containing protein n=1 Tax=Trichogramma brassicae TaxID=86971 RepID=A0A6H5IHT9_9HYME|nr:unnamed protein product [Trichogramma brassicae]